MPQHFRQEEKKISFKECKAILNVNGNSYTDEEILKIRDYLYRLAAIEVEHFNTLQEGKKEHEKPGCESGGKNSDASC